MFPTRPQDHLVPDRVCASVGLCRARLSDRTDPVPDEIWDETARHYDERGLGALFLWIATTNVFDRVDVTTRQLAGSAS